MPKTVLLTGGAGFIGSHLAEELIHHGYRVRALDSLCEQVHGPNSQRPEYLHPDVELMVGDVRDPQAVRKALRGVDMVGHFAAKVGVGQSMYDVHDYVDVNNNGTAVLLEALIESPVEKLIVASSMSVYGEGLYRRPDGSICGGYERPLEQLRDSLWELSDDNAEPWSPLPTPETKEPSLASIYALSKYDQERMCLLIGRAYEIPTVALRFFNAHGPHQALSNPYTGVLAIFASRILNGNPPLIFEDGCQQRDFVSVHDIARACRLSLEAQAASGQVINVGSGRNYTVLEVAEKMTGVLNRRDLLPEVIGKYRMGDIRHCFADITRARTILGYEPLVDLDAGLIELAEWLEGQVAIDRAAEARDQLFERGLAI